MTLLAQKSLLAKLMATENLTIQQKSVHTASFDVLNRVLTVPVLDNNISKELYDLFMGHEVGHALYTPLEGMRKAKADKVNMSVLNVVEDSRIERKIKNKYPGIKSPFVKAYSELFEKNFFETEGKDINDYNFIDRVNLHCKIGASLALPFNDVERELLRKVETTETYDDAVEVTKEICEYMAQQIQEEIENEIEVLTSAGQNSDMEGDSEGEQRPSDTQNEQEDTKESEDEQESPKKSEKKDENQEKQEDGGFTESVAAQGVSKSETPVEIRSYTDDAYRKNEERLFSKDQTEYLYCNVPAYDMKKIMDYKEVYKRYKEYDSNVSTARFNEYRRESNKVVSYLVKEFELRKNADQLKRATSARTGELNLNRIYAYKLTDDIFKKMTVMPDGKSHGLVMFLDWSGSMCKHIHNTIKQLLNLAMFCKKVNIPFEVYTFVEHTDADYTFRNPHKDNDLYISGFGLLNLLSNRMNSNEFTFAASALMRMTGSASRGRIWCPDFMQMNGTPLNEAVIAAMEIVPHFQKKNNLQIVNTVFLTDGEGSRLDYVFNKSMPKNKYTHMVIRDPKTKHEETFELSKAYSYMEASMAQTDCFIRLLKHRTNSHVIGFFVGETKDVTARAKFFFPELKKIPKDKHYEMTVAIDNIKNKFRTNNSLVVTSTGFDDYYILRSDGLDTDDDEELTFKDNATTRGMVSAFSKHAGKKISSRVILTRFIDLIA